MQFKGLGVPNKYFATQKKQMYIRLHCLRMLWNLSTCFPNLKIILQSGPSVFKFNLKRTVIFLLREFRVCIRSKQGELVPPRKFWTWFFTNPASKHLLGFAQTRYSAQNCAGYTFPRNSSPCKGFLRKSRPCKNRALTVQTPIFRGYITKKNAKSYDLTFNIWCTSRDSNPGPTD